MGTDLARTQNYIFRLYYDTLRNSSKESGMGSSLVFGQVMMLEEMIEDLGWQDDYVDWVMEHLPLH